MERLFAIIIAAMVLLWACRVPADVVKVGLLADFTGAFATWGPQFQEGVAAYQALHSKIVKGPDDKPHEIQFIYRDTASVPLGPWVAPGQYTVRLTVDGKRHEQPLTVKMDPRVKTPAEGLARQFELSIECYEGMRQAREALSRVRALRARVQEVQDREPEKALAEALTELDNKAAALEGAPMRASLFG